MSVKIQKNVRGFIVKKKYKKKLEKKRREELGMELNNKQKDMKNF